MRIHSTIKSQSETLAMARKLGINIGALRRAAAAQGIGARAVFPARRRGVGANGNCRNDLSACPPQPCDTIETSCDCTLVGFSTLAGSTIAVGAVPIVPGATATLVVTGQDADVKPQAIWFTAFQASAAAPTTRIASPVVEVPVQLSDARIGQQGQIRNGGTIAMGINSAGLSATREPVCVDWQIFKPSQGQQLNLDLTNIVDTVNIHVFGIIWGTVAGCD